MTAADILNAHFQLLQFKGYQSFFEPFAEKQFEFSTLSSTLLTKWETLRDTASAQAILIVQSNKSSIDPPDTVGGEDKRWPGTARAFYCIVCDDHLFLFNFEDGTQVSELPAYYLIIEFASLKVIKNSCGLKCGFSLVRADTRHDFIIMR